MALGPSESAATMMLGTGMTVVDRLALLYLSLPVAVFLVCWFMPIVAVPLAIAALSGLGYVFPLGDWKVSGRAVLAASTLTLLWSALSGASHFFYAGAALNWPIRDAVLHDLVTFTWPVTYPSGDGAATILRAPIAYYLLPALAARLAGSQFAFILLYLWTALGVFIFLLQVMAEERRWLAIAVIAALVVLFSGMDLLAPSDMLHDPATGVLQQATFYQSTYDANLLIGFPNHAVPGWLATALIYRGLDDPRFLRIAAWLGALTLIWAPLVSIGLLPFFLATAWRHFAKGGWRDLFSACNLIAAPAVALASGLYLTLGAGTITETGAQTSALLPAPTAGFLPVYACYMLFEFGALCLALVFACRGVIEPLFFAIAIASLLILPWFHFGPNNDLVTRGSIPALTVILFTAIDGWARPVRLGGRAIFITIFLLLGAVIPVARMAQVLSTPAWKPDTQQSVYEITAGGSANYLAVLRPDTVLGHLLKAPP
jgi:hypothetical protein